MACNLVGVRGVDVLAVLGTLDARGISGLIAHASGLHTDGGLGWWQ
jgi:hypothetical protein